MNKPKTQPDPHVFSFRLPDECLDWLDTHVPGIQDNRHQALRGFVIQTIQSNPDYVPADNDPIQRLRVEMQSVLEEQAERTKQELRDFVRKLIGDGKTFQQIQTLREVSEGDVGDDIPEDVINNILAGIT